MPTLAETWVKQGLEQGIEQGSLISLRTTLRRLLTKRFGPLPQTIDERIENAESAVLEAWLDQVIDTPSLERMFDETH